MNNLDSAEDVHSRDHNAAFGDVEEERIYYQQIPFSDYEKQAIDEAEEIITSQQTPFIDYEERKSPDGELHN